MGIIKGKEIKAVINSLYQFKIDVPQIKKQGKNTCWAGCYRMIDTYHGNIRQFDYYLKLQNKSCLTNSCQITPCKTCDQPRQTKDILGDLTKLSFGKTVHHNCHFNVLQIMESLKLNKPLMIFKDNSPKVGHFVLITGVVNRSFFRNKCLVINDPDKHKKDIVDITDACLTGGVWNQTWDVQ